MARSEIKKKYKVKLANSSVFDIGHYFPQVLMLNTNTDS